MYGNKAITVQKDWQEFWPPVKMAADDNKVGIYVESGTVSKGMFGSMSFVCMKGIMNLTQRDRPGTKSGQ